MKLYIPSLMVLTGLAALIIVVVSAFYPKILDDGRVVEGAGIALVLVAFAQMRKQ